jgi:hypothetical protein
MKINITYLKNRDLFEMQIIEPRLRSHFLVNRKVLNDLRALLERVLVETASQKKNQ